MESKGKKFEVYYAGRAVVGSPSVADHTLTVKVQFDSMPFLMSKLPIDLEPGIATKPVKVQGNRIFHAWLLHGVGLGNYAEDVLRDCSEGEALPIGCRRLALVTLETEQAIGKKDGTVFIASMSCQMPEPSHPLFALAMETADVVLGFYRAQPELPMKDQPAEKAQPEPTGPVLELEFEAEIKEGDVVTHIHDPAQRLMTVDTLQYDGDAREAKCVWHDGAEPMAVFYPVIDLRHASVDLRLTEAEGPGLMDQVQSDNLPDPIGEQAGLYAGMSTEDLLRLLEADDLEGEHDLTVVAAELNRRKPLVADDLLDSVAGIEHPVSMGDRSARANRGKKPVEA